MPRNSARNYNIPPPCPKDGSKKSAAHKSCRRYDVCACLLRSSTIGSSPNVCTRLQPHTEVFIPIHPSPFLFHKKRHLVLKSLQQHLEQGKLCLCRLHGSIEQSVTPLTSVFHCYITHGATPTGIKLLLLQAAGVEQQPRNSAVNLLPFEHNLYSH